jgi:hypothetical protein
MRKFTILVVLLCIGLYYLGCKSYTATIEWKHPTPNSVAGFKVYGGRSSGVYTLTLDLGKINPVGYEGTIGVYKHTQPISDRYYKNIRYCAMSAYNSEGKEGPLSIETSVTAASGVLNINFN